LSQLTAELYTWVGFLVAGEGKRLHLYPELANRFPKLDGQNAMKKARIRFLNTQSRNSCEVIVRYGMTDTCKTHMAINSDWPTESQYVKVCTKDNKWFCDYDGQRKVQRALNADLLTVEC
jgi:hypothetical protein